MGQGLDLSKIRQQLEAELDRLQAHMQTKTGGSGRRDGKNLDRDDLAHNFTSRERRLALQDVNEAQVAQIKAALGRITDGTYGKCTHCGQAIAPGRLEIIPYAALCIHCQQEQGQV